MATYPIRTRRWTRKEYGRLIELGILHEDERIELLGGQLVVAEPKSSPHATAVRLTAKALRLAFGEGWVVLVQDPIALDDESEPEPDIAVVAGDERDYRDAHPHQTALVVEVVAFSSLAFDRRHKAKPVRARRCHRLLDRESRGARRGGTATAGGRAERRLRRRVSGHRHRGARRRGGAAGQAGGARPRRGPAALG
jgi:hypothetical protein